MLVSHQVYSLTATQCPTLRYASSVHVKPLVSSRVCLFAYSVVNDPLSLSPSIPRRLDANFPVAISQGPLDSLPVSPFGSVSCEVSSPRCRRCIPAEIQATAPVLLCGAKLPQCVDSKGETILSNERRIGPRTQRDGSPRAWFRVSNRGQAAGAWQPLGRLYYVSYRRPVPLSRLFASENALAPRAGDRESLSYVSYGPGALLV